MNNGKKTEMVRLELLFIYSLPYRPVRTSIKRDVDSNAVATAMPNRNYRKYLTLVISATCDVTF